MNDERKNWCKKYNINIASNGFVDVFCGLPKHVEPVLPTNGEPIHYIGFDGKAKTYSDLTEEELEDLEGRKNRIEKSLSEFCKKRKEEQQEER